MQIDAKLFSTFLRLFCYFISLCSKIFIVTLHSTEFIHGHFSIVETSACKSRRKNSMSMGILLKFSLFNSIRTCIGSNVIVSIESAQVICVTFFMIFFHSRRHQFAHIHIIFANCDFDNCKIPKLEEKGFYSAFFFYFNKITYENRPDCDSWGILSRDRS